MADAVDSKSTFLKRKCGLNSHLQHHQKRTKGKTVNKKKVQEWIDERFGIPNTFNIQLLLDFQEAIRKDDKKSNQDVRIEP